MTFLKERAKKIQLYFLTVLWPFVTLSSFSNARRRELKKKQEGA